MIFRLRSSLRIGTVSIPQTRPGAGRARDLSLLARQVRYEQRIYWRNRGRGLVTFLLPILFLVIFASLDQGAHLSSRGNIPYDDFFIPGILAYGVISTTFQTLAASTAILRDNGIEFLDMALEMQPLAQPAKLFGYISRIARLRSIQDQDASLVASHCG